MVGVVNNPEERERALETAAESAKRERENALRIADRIDQIIKLGHFAVARLADGRHVTIGDIGTVSQTACYEITPTNERGAFLGWTPAKSSAPGKPELVQNGLVLVFSDKAFNGTLGDALLLSNVVAVTPGDSFLDERGFYRNARQNLTPTLQERIADGAVRTREL